MSRKLLLICIVASASLWAQKKPVTIEMLATGTPARAGFGPVVWSQDGKSFAFREGNKLLRYDVASRQQKEIADLTKLRNQAVDGAEPKAFGWRNRNVEEQAFQWSRSGREMLISAGGDLFLAHLDSGAMEQLTATPERESDPKLSPDGQYVSFRRNNDLYCLDIAATQVRRLTADGSPALLNGGLDWVYPEELELSTAYWWSPDSTQIAYLQFDVSRELVFPQIDLLPTKPVFEPERFPQPGTPNADVRLGVISATGGATRWMDLGEMRDHLLARVYWSPDSRALAAERLNRVQNRLDLDLADAATGETRTILDERDPYWINVNDDFRFLGEGKQFLWGSERSGFLHLYLYSIDGKQVKQLTRGDWEVTDVAGVDEAARQVYFVSTGQSPLERQLYRVGLDGKGKTRLTSTPGTHAISMSPNCAAYLDTASSLTSPPRRTIHQPDGSLTAVFRESEPVDYEVLPTEIVKLKAADGQTLYGRMIKPAGFDAHKKYPVVVIVYGGPGAQSVRDAWSGATWEQALAQRGFLIWQLDNRGSAGRGHRFETPVFRNFGAVELEDQKQGVGYLESLAFADTSRMGLYGWSYGGFMTLYSLCNAPGLFRAGIAGAPVTDWRNYDSIYTERYMGLPDENEAGYNRSSPIGKAAQLNSKLLLVHNLEDDNVHFQNTVQMINALEHAGKMYQLQVYPQKAHGVSGAMRKHLLETTTEFFEQNLKRPENP